MGRYDFIRGTDVTTYPKNINLPQCICILHTSLSSSVHHMVISAFEGRGQLKCDGTCTETRFHLWRNGRVLLYWRGHQFSGLLAAEVCASTVVMLDTPCSEVVRRVLATHSIYQFPFHFPSHMSTCAITFQQQSTINLKPKGHRTVQFCGCQLW